MVLETLGVTSLQACIIGLVSGLLVYWIVQRRRYSMPPGPFALPLLGNALQMKNRFLHVQIAQEWAKKYGPVVTVRFGPMAMVFVNNLESAMEVLVKKSTDFAGRYQLPSLSYFTSGGKDIAFGDYGPVWKLQRKSPARLLGKYYMQGDALEKRVHLAVETGFAEMDKETGPFEPKAYINFIIGHILTGLCFGGKFDFNDNEVSGITEATDEFTEIAKYGFLEDFVPGLRFVYTSRAFRELKRLTKMTIDDFVGRKFFEAEKTFDRENIRHFTDMLLLAREEAQKEGGDEALKSLTDMHFIQTLTDVFFAGIDTSRLTLRFALLHMMAFMDIQDKVQEEIDRVVGRERLPGMADRPDLAYTEAVLHESMRLATVAPIGVTHMTTCDTTLVGYHLPKGTQVSVNQWALHNDPEAWEDVDRFIPERFLDENGRMGPKPPNWLPFSAGKRVCMGEFVAKPELHLLFASLMQRYTWRTLSGTQPDLAPAGSIVGVLPKDCRVVITKRVP